MVQREPGPRHPDGLGVVPRLAVLLRELGEQARPGIALEPASEFVDASLSHGQKGAGPTVSRPAPLLGTLGALAYHRWKISTVR